MNCPHCAVPLIVSQRHEIEIDHCPQCRGVWLDKGEIDKLVAKRTSPPEEEYDDEGDSPQSGRGRHQQENPLLDLLDFF